MNDSPLFYSAGSVAAFLLDHQRALLQAWAERARAEIPAAQLLDRWVLYDSLPEFLSGLADALTESAPSARGGEHHTAQDHAEQRAHRVGYSLDQMMAEYHLLKKVLLETLEAQVPLSSALRTRIEDYIFQDLQAAVLHYVSTVEAERRAQADEQARLLAKTTEILESIGDAFFALDPEWRFTYINHRAEELWGRPRETLLGRTLWEGFPQARDSRASERFRQAAREQQAIEFEAFSPVLHRWVEVSAYPSTAGLSVYFRDIGARKASEKALRESEARYRRLVDGNIIGVIEIGIHGHLFSANERFLEMTGYTQAEVCSGALRWTEITPPEFLPRDECGIAELLERGACTPYEKEYLRKDGTRLPILIGYAQLEATSDRCICFVLDLTEQKNLEAQLHRRAEELVLADRQKNEFLAVLAHELRNPLAPLQNAAYLLKLRIGTDRHLLQIKDIIERQVHTMVHLIDDLLDVSRISRGKVSLEEEVVELATVVENAVQTSRPLLEARHHHFTVSLPDAPVLLQVDPTRLEQVFSNLLNNAAKFTEPGGEIALAASRQDDHVIVRVTDNGRGMEPALG